MIKNYLKIAWRNLIKNRTFTIINVGGLALGMAVTLLIALWVEDELSHNSYFGNSDRIASVLANRTYNGYTDTNLTMARPLEFVLREQYSEYFDHIVMSKNWIPQYLEYDGKKISKTGNFMQNGAPDMLGLNMVSGEKDGLRDMNSIMLDESTAQVLFGAENPIGKTVEVNGEFGVTVSGVYADIPFNSSFYGMRFLMPLDRFIASREWARNIISDWGNHSFNLYVQIAKNTQMSEVSEKIKNIEKEQPSEAQFNPELFLFPMEDWHLRSQFKGGKQVGGRITYVWLFGIIGVFVLLLACINFMNLSTARSEKRSKEVGIRKSIGSHRTQLVKQFLGESFLVVVFAFVCAILIVQLSLDSFNDLAQKEIVFPWNESFFWAASVLFIFVTSLLAGSYPAMYLSSFKPIDVLKGSFKIGKQGATPRKVLVVFQFTVSVAFIIGTVIVAQQINHAKNRPSGYDKEGLVQLPVMSKEFLGKQDLLRDEFMASGAITEMSTSSSPTTGVWSTWGGFVWEGQPDDFQVDMAWTWVSPEYVESLNMDIVEGRDFSRTMATDSMTILINRTAMDYMGLSDPVGKHIWFPSEEGPQFKMKIIGVVEDIIAQSPYEPVKQSIYAYDRANNASFYNLRLNPAQGTAENLARIERVFKQHFPQLPFEYQFVDEEYGKKFASEERIGTLSGVFTTLAILISCLGLFGLTSFVAEQRTKEIGVRKVLGATVFNVWNMLSRGFLKLVVLACLIAVPIAYYIMDGWLEEFTYRIILKWWMFALAIFGAVLVTLVTISFQAIRAARANPIASLRTE
nr:FtsX-like permease family protein [Allomuricauda sp.]